MYRDLALNGPPCARHPSAQAVESCARCGVRLCEPCVVYANVAAHCSLCARTTKRWQLVRVTAGSVAMSGLSMLVLLLVLTPRLIQSGLQRVAHDRQLAALATAARGTRCDLGATARYEEALPQRGAARAMLRDGAEHRMPCGKGNARLGRLRFRAFEALGRHERAAAEATEMMAEDPRDSEYLMIPAAAWAALDTTAAATADYAPAFELRAKDPNILFLLANQMKTAGGTCKARTLVERYLDNVRDKLPVEQSYRVYPR